MVMFAEDQEQTRENPSSETDLTIATSRVKALELFLESRWNDRGLRDLYSDIYEICEQQGMTVAFRNAFVEQVSSSCVQLTHPVEFESTANDRREVLFPCWMMDIPGLTWQCCNEAAKAICDGHLVEAIRQDGIQGVRRFPDM